jgi:hypothetical protein
VPPATFAALTKESVNLANLGLLEFRLVRGLGAGQERMTAILGGFKRSTLHRNIDLGSNLQ